MRPPHPYRAASHHRSRSAACSELQFVALNIDRHDVRKRTSFIAPRGYLTWPGFANHDGDHAHLYQRFPKPVLAARQS